MSLLDYIESSNAKHILNNIFAGSFSEELNYISINSNSHINSNNNSNNNYYYNNTNRNNNNNINN